MYVFYCSSSLMDWRRLRGERAVPSTDREVLRGGRSPAPLWSSDLDERRGGRSADTDKRAPWKCGPSAGEQSHGQGILNSLVASHELAVQSVDRRCKQPQSLLNMLAPQKTTTHYRPRNVHRTRFKEKNRFQKHN